MSAPVPLVIDTDTAQDDCVAILVGLLDPGADLRALTLVAGNVGFDQQVHNAVLTLQVGGGLGQVPVYAGCRRPMVKPWASAENVHGDGIGGQRFDGEAGEHVADEHAVTALIRLAREHRGELRIVAIGPLTNIAMATVLDPEFASNVKELVVMGGSNNGRGNITAAAEYNFYVDPEAAKVVLDAGFAVTIVPWDPLTLRDAVLDDDELARLRAVNTPTSAFVDRLLLSTLEFDRSVGIEGSTHPDSLSVAVLLHPELVLAASGYHVDVDTGGGLARGYSAMSWGVHGAAANARVVEHIDHDGFRDLLERIIAQTRD